MPIDKSQSALGIRFITISGEVDRWVDLSIKDAEVDSYFEKWTDKPSRWNGDRDDYEVNDKGQLIRLGNQIDEEKYPAKGLYFYTTSMAHKQYKRYGHYSVAALERDPMFDHWANNARNRELGLYKESTIPPPKPRRRIKVTVLTDSINHGEEPRKKLVDLPLGSTVQDAVKAAGWEQPDAYYKVRGNSVTKNYLLTNRQTVFTSNRVYGDGGPVAEKSSTLPQKSKKLLTIRLMSNDVGVGAFSTRYISLREGDEVDDALNAARLSTENAIVLRNGSKIHLSDKVYDKQTLHVHYKTPEEKTFNAADIVRIMAGGSDLLQLEGRRATVLSVCTCGCAAVRPDGVGQVFHFKPEELETCYRPGKRNMYWSVNGEKSRDISQSKRYKEEYQTTGVEETMTYLERQEASGIKLGDKVEVTESAYDGDNGWDNTWESFMDDFIGQVCKVIAIRGAEGISLCHPNGRDEADFPYFVLRKQSTEDQFLKSARAALGTEEKAERLPTELQKQMLDVQNWSLKTEVTTDEEFDEEYNMTSWIKAKLPDGRVIESPPVDDSWEEVYSDRWQEGEASFQREGTPQDTLVVDDKFDDEPVHLPMQGEHQECWLRDMKPILHEVQMDGNTAKQADVLGAKRYRKEKESKALDPEVAAAKERSIDDWEASKSYDNPSWPERGHPSGPARAKK